MSDPSRLGATAPVALAMVAAVTARGGPFLALLITARLLSPEEFGAYAVAGVAANLLGALVSGGGSLWTNRYATEAIGASRWRDDARQSYLEIVFSLAGLVLVMGLLALLAVPDQWRGLIIASTATAVMVGLAESVFSILRSAGKVTYFFLIRDLTLPTVYLALLLLVLPRSAAGALGLLPLASAFPLLAGILRLRRLGFISSPNGTRRRGARLRRLWGYSLNLIANNLVGRLAAYADIFVIGALVSAPWVGEYRAAAQLALGFAVVQNAVFLGLPWQLRAQGGHHERAARVAQVLGRQRLLVAAAALALLGMEIFAAEVLSLFGPALVDMAPLLRLLCLLRFLDLLWGPQQQLLISNGLVREDSRSALLGLLVWLAGFALLQGLLPTLLAAVAAHGLASPCGQLMRWRALRRSGIEPPLAGAPALNALALCYASALIMTYLSGS